MVYSFADGQAKEQRHTRYFEMFGNRAIYNDGWIAAARHGRLPWQNIGTSDFDKDKWELYNVANDFSEANDKAATESRRLRDLHDLFWVEAAKYNVLPLDDRFVERADSSLRPSLIAGRTDFVYYPGAVRIPESSAASTKSRSHTITATIYMPQNGGDGVLVAAGGLVAGYALYIKDGKPTYEYNWFSQQRYKVTGAEKLPPGPATIRVDFKYDGGGAAKGGTITLFVNDKQVGEGRVDKTVLARYSADETFDIGMDTGSPVSDDYASPNPFTGTLKKVEIHLNPVKLDKAENDESVRPSGTPPARLNDVRKAGCTERLSVVRNTRGDKHGLSTACGLGRSAAAPAQADENRTSRGYLRKNLTPPRQAAPIASRRPLLPCEQRNQRHHW